MIPNRIIIIASASVSGEYVTSSVHAITVPIITNMIPVTLTVRLIALSGRI